MHLQIRVLTFLDYYVPGYKSGGPPKTIHNLIKYLGSEFEFLIVTRDRDFDDDEPYSHVQANNWVQVDNAKIFYASPSMFSFRGIRCLLNNTPHDILYLNSFVSPRASILPILIRWLGLAPQRPIIIAPRGEFSSAALAIKPIKKRLFLMASKLLGLHRAVMWQASSPEEVQAIRRTVGFDSRGIGVAPNIPDNIKIAPDLISDPEIMHMDAHRISSVNPSMSTLRMIFLSRISPMKNLDFLLCVLSRVTSALRLTIYGVVSEPEYWAECQELMRSLPDHIIVHYAGAITPNEVPLAFSENDLFVFPTRGENFGHVIHEALAAGTPVILSDRTPWAADAHGAIEILSLDDPDAWIAAISRWASFTPQQRNALRIEAKRYASSYLENSDSICKNRDLFQNVHKKLSSKLRSSSCCR